MPWVNEYVEPEVAFEIRMQCTEEQVQQHCDAAPENDRRDFDNRLGLNLNIYHVYKNQEMSNRLTYWYTTDEEEDDEYEFDIRTLPNYEPGDDHYVALQSAVKHGLVRFVDDKLVLPEDEQSTSTFDTPKDALAAVVAISMGSLRDGPTKGGK